MVACGDLVADLGSSWSPSIDHPYGALAVGSGFASGSTIADQKWARVYTSLCTLAISASPEIGIFMSDGNISNLTTGLLGRVLLYGAGVVAGTIFEAIVSGDYCAVFDLEARFDSEEKAKKVYEILKEVIKGGSSIHSGRSKLTAPVRAGESYLVTARIVGKPVELRNNIFPDITEYIRTSGATKVNISNVISTGSKS